MKGRINKYEIMEQLYGLYEQKIYTTAFSVLHQVEQAEDVVQEVFIQAYHHMEKLLEVKSVETKRWLLRVARNKAIDVYRKNRNQSEKIADLSHFQKQQNVIDDVADKMQELITEEQMISLMKDLSVQQKNIFKYKVFYDLNFKEIATLLDIRESNARKIYERTRKKFKLRLEMNKMKGKQNNLDKVLKEVAEKIALDDFEQENEPHVFSEKYQKQKGVILREVNQKETNKHKKQWVAAAALLVLVPTTAFAAQKLYQMNVEKHQYEAKISVENKQKQNTSAQFYELQVKDLPKGIIQSPEKIKYGSTDEKSHRNLSFDLLKLGKRKTDLSELNVENMEKIQITGHEAWLIDKATLDGEATGFNQIAFVLFEKEGYLLKVYVDSGIQLDELKKTLNSVTLVPTTKEKATFTQDYDKMEKDTIKKTTILPLAKDSKQIAKIGETTKTSNLDLKVDKMQVFNDLSNIPKDNFNDFSLERLKDKNILTEENQLKAYKRKTVQAGKGKNTVDKVTKKEMIQPKFIYLTVTLTNNSNEILTNFYFSPRLTNMKETEKGWIYQEQNNTSIETSELDYLSDHGEEKSFYKMMELAPHETKTFQIGYFVDEDHLNRIFLDLFNNGYSSTTDNLNAKDRYWIDLRQK